MARRSVAETHYTYADLAETPDDGRRYEVIDGELTVTPAPVPSHQRLIVKLVHILESHAQANGLGNVYCAPLDVVLEETNVLEPDVLFVSSSRLSIVGEKRIQGAPDLVVEILSKGTLKRDRVTKKELYARFGVKHYWIVDPFAEEIEENVLRRGKYASRVVKGRGTFEPQCFPGLVIDLTKVWA
jgi:Uma2 family endonuclease